MSDSKMFSKEEVLRVLRKIIAVQLDIDEGEILLNTNPINELGADSLDLVEIIMEAEEVFGISIGDEELEEASTLEDFLNCVMSKL
jgi:acyl carrier protein